MKDKKKIVIIILILVIVIVIITCKKVLFGKGTTLSKEFLEIQYNNIDNGYRYIFTKNGYLCSHASEESEDDETNCMKVLISKDKTELSYYDSITLYDTDFIYKSAPNYKGYNKLEGKSDILALDNMLFITKSSSTDYLQISYSKYALKSTDYINLKLSGVYYANNLGSYSKFTFFKNGKVIKDQREDDDPRRKEEQEIFKYKIIDYHNGYYGLLIKNKKDEKLLDILKIKNDDITFHILETYSEY